MISEGGPIRKEELTSFILSHDADTILQFLSFLEPDTEAEFRSSAEALFRSAQATGLETPDIEEKLKGICDS
jgi:hypothetical protein